MSIWSIVYDFLDNGMNEKNYFRITFCLDSIVNKILKLEIHMCLGQKFSNV